MIPFQASPPIAPLGITGTSTAPRRFECAVPSCKKVFRRKEHLTRHLKSHDDQLQYLCHICGRRYARSDVLKRHIECHPQYYKAKRDFVACTRCRESKTKCDEDSPCKPCRRKELHCVRTHGGEANVNTAGIVLESPPDMSSPSSGSIRGPEESKLREYIAKNRDTIERRLPVYFAGIHPSWPLLQPSMVTVSGSPDLLISTIVMLASWLEGDLDHLALYPLVFEEIMERQLGPNPPLPVLQAMALCTLYSICCVATEGIALKAFRVHSSLVTACRFAGIFAPQRRIQYTGEEQQEPESRLAFAVLRLDAYLTAILDFPPMIRYQELSMPLSQTTCWIPVASEEERRRLLQDENSMRKKTSFCARVHDMFGTPRPNLFASRWTRMDYHFILCAIQSGAWEACHQVFRSVPDDIYSRTHPQDLRDFWRECLRTWASGLETDCQDYFTTPYGDDISPQTLLLWHMTNIKLRTPPDLWELQGRYFNISAVNTRLRQSLASAIRPWQSSKVARQAVWHSAQIARIASNELSPENSTARIRLNPILIPSLLMSAILILAYTYYTRICPNCTGGGPIDLVLAFAAPKDCERLGEWLEEGATMVTWGMNVFTGCRVCQCSVVQLSGWFRELLARDKQADAALVQFLDELQAGLW